MGGGKFAHSRIQELPTWDTYWTLKSLYMTYCDGGNMAPRAGKGLSRADGGSPSGLYRQKEHGVHWVPPLEPENITPFYE